MIPSDEKKNQGDVWVISRFFSSGAFIKRKRQKNVDRKCDSIYRNIMILNHAQTNARKWWWYSMISNGKGGLP
jgi:hypothetical protein